MMTRCAACVLTFVLLLLPGHVPAAPQSPGAPGPGPGNAEPPALVSHPLADVPPDDPIMEAYSHGNYVLFLVEYLWSAALLAVIVVSGFGATLLVWAGRAGGPAGLRVAIYAGLFGLVTFLGNLPLRVYASFVREKEYGFARQTFAAWLGDRGKGLVVGLIVQTVFLVILYAAIRRFGRLWWMAGAFLTVLFTILVVAITPVFIAPLFNRFEPLTDRALRAEILEMARREGIPADEVYEVDASRQSGHNNAYVAGLLGTERIVLYDTLLRNLHPREIKAVMGHEMGHYVLHHVWKTVAFLSLLIVAGAFLIDRISRRIIERRPGLGIPALDEPSSLPLMAFVLTALLFFAGPLLATFSRAQEQEADRFGLEVTNDPAAAASAFLKYGRLDLDEYHVSPWIETLLYTHPSLARRIGMAQDYARRHGLVGPSEER
jgi:Zn-dependent protease with chaperone function